MAIDRKINTNKKQFDLKTHIRDGKGNIKEAKPYRLTITNGVKEFERPPGSGNFYTEGGDLIRSPKETVEGGPKQSKSEFTNDELLKQLEALQAQVEKTSLNKENPEALDSATVDLSEELSIMEQSGAIKEAAELKAAKFNKPSYAK